MNFSYKIDNDVLIVSVEGRFDIEAATRFDTELAELCKANAQD